MGCQCMKQDLTSPMENLSEKRKQKKSRDKLKNKVHTMVSTEASFLKKKLSMDCNHFYSLI